MCDQKEMLFINSLVFAEISSTEPVVLIQCILHGGN